MFCVASHAGLPPVCAHATSSPSNHWLRHSYAPWAAARKDDAINNAAGGVAGALRSHGKVIACRGHAARVVGPSDYALPMVGTGPLLTTETSVACNRQPHKCRDNGKPALRMRAPVPPAPCFPARALTVSTAVSSVWQVSPNKPQLQAQGSRTHSADTSMFHALCPVRSTGMGVHQDPLPNHHCIPPSHHPLTNPACCPWKPVSPLTCTLKFRALPSLKSRRTPSSIFSVACKRQPHKQEQLATPRPGHQSRLLPPCSCAHAFHSFAIVVAPTIKIKILHVNDIHARWERGWKHHTLRMSGCYHNENPRSHPFDENHHSP